MAQIETFNQNTEAYEAWFEEHQAVHQSELLAVRHQLSKLPENIKGIEVGLGTGQFAAPLGIKEGIEPAENMAAIARQRGIEIMPGNAERLPYRAIHFDFVLLVTICHLDNIKAAFKEAYRVLKNKGSIIVGFIREDGPIAQEYQLRRKSSTFYKQAKFYRTSRVTELLTKIGFQDLDYVQTLFGRLDEIETVQLPEPGCEEGSFIVVKGQKCKLSKLFK